MFFALSRLSGSRTSTTSQFAFKDDSAVAPADVLSGKPDDQLTSHGPDLPTPHTPGFPTAPLLSNPAALGLERDDPENVLDVMPEFASDA